MMPRSSGAAAWQKTSAGYAGVQDEKTPQWAEHVSRNLRGKQNEDLVLGDKLVSEAERGQLEWAGLLAIVRCGFLEELISIIESRRVPASPMGTIFARDAAPDPEYYAESSAYYLNQIAITTEQARRWNGTETLLRSGHAYNHRATQNLRSHSEEFARCR
ncbi:hypothetical protein [Occallatibacter riparius]|uniref:Uncharacterized protein n=1 Tax=Occallatibacter riparius TaxID=1002689 RepID=A0A9J7BIU6_9BACT|nr:hypothetical protein [Occallatibacter riparius]UWZ82607.1 hypothetical protein MOP44_18795 [Occallatibacter riparius]